jgi:beta-glucosidase
LRVRFRLGEFDPFDAVPYSKIPTDVIGSAKHRAIALEAARRSIVLLQNRDHLLPLDRTQVKCIAVLGPLADRVVMNNYNGKAVNTVSALQGIKDRAPAAEIVTDLQQVARSDVAIVCVGTTPNEEHEGRDRKSLGLPGGHQELVRSVVAANPRTVVVQMSAGPLTVPWLKDHVPAMLQAWWGGEEGGHALADVLFGDANPAGRLPHTVYASEAQVPPDHEYDITKGFTYMYVQGSPLFPFGHGLSYTAFDYSSLRVAIPSVSVDVRNVGGLAGDEVVQLYVREVHPRVKRPAKELRGFERINLQPGETRTVTFDLPRENLAYYDETAHAFVVAPGMFEFQVGSSSADIRLQQQVEVQ